MKENGQGGFKDTSSIVDVWHVAGLLSVYVVVSSVCYGVVLLLCFGVNPYFYLEIPDYISAFFSVSVYGVFIFVAVLILYSVCSAQKMFIWYVKFFSRHKILNYFASILFYFLLYCSSFVCSSSIFLVYLHIILMFFCFLHSKIIYRTIIQLFCAFFLTLLIFCSVFFPSLYCFRIVNDGLDSPSLHSGADHWVKSEDVLTIAQTSRYSFVYDRSNDVMHVISLSDKSKTTFKRRDIKSQPIIKVYSFLSSIRN